MKQTMISTQREMQEFGLQCAQNAKKGDIFALVGELGAGKTQWSQGFVNGISATDHVSSPTFSILNEYRDGEIPIFHFDFYRLNTAEDLLSLGWDEYLEDEGIVICEWANLFPELIPDHALWLEIHHLEDGTRLVVEKSKLSQE